MRQSQYLQEAGQGIVIVRMSFARAWRKILLAYSVLYLGSMAYLLWTVYATLGPLFGQIPPMEEVRLLQNNSTVGKAFILFAVVFLVGIPLLGSRLAWAAYSRYEALRHPEKNPRPVPSTEDNSILQIARDLCVKFQIPKRYDLQKIIWNSRLSPLQVQVTPGFHIRGVVLPAALIGKLSPEEWKPLIGTHLARIRAYRSKRMFGQMWVRGFGPFILLFFTGAIFSLVFGRQWTQFLFAPLLLVGSFLVIASLVRYGRRLELALDLEASRYVGRPELLQVLKKIDSMHLEGVERAKSSKRLLARLFFFEPTIAERIMNLEADQESSTFNPVSPK